MLFFFCFLPGDDLFVTEMVGLSFKDERFGLFEPLRLLNSFFSGRSLFVLRAGIVIVLKKTKHEPGSESVAFARYFSDSDST